jgi:phospholipase C
VKTPRARSRALPFFVAPILGLVACSAAPGDDASSNDEEAISAHCGHREGSLPSETLKHVPNDIPIKHVIIVTQENRSFDHIYGSLAFTRTDVDGLTHQVMSDYVNLDKDGHEVRFQHRHDTCFEGNPNHAEEGIESDVHDGKMDDFVRNAAVGGSDGHYVMSYYTEEELPFYYFLADHFSIGDRYFSPMQGPTHPNREFLYAATGSEQDPMKGVTTIFNELDAHHVSWGVYSSGPPRQDCLGWDQCHKGFHSEGDFFNALKDKKLPDVVFLDPGPREDEHPPNDVQGGERLAQRIYDAVRESSVATETAIFFTYDEAGGIADHVPPPPACAPKSNLKHVDQYGVRVPITVVSAYAKPHYVSHVVHSHTSILRFVELLHGLPALTTRDANDINAMLDMFDFNQKHDLPAAPEAGHGACSRNPRGWLQDEGENLLNTLERWKCDIPFL